MTLTLNFYDTNIKFLLTLKFFVWIDEKEKKLEEFHSHFSARDQEEMKKFDAMDFDFIENDLQRIHDNNTYNWTGYAEWLIFGLIGISCGILARLMALFVSNVQHLRYTTVQHIVESNDLVGSYFLFTLTGMALTSIAAYLCIFVLPQG